MKEQIPQITLLYRDRTVRRSHRSCSIRKLLLRISQYPHEAPVFESIFKKVADFSALLKRDTNTEKIFNTNFFEKTSAKGCFLLFSMVHCYMDLKVWSLDCMTASGFRVWVTGLGFVFKSATLVLKWVPTCIWKLKTNAFDKSIKFLHWLFLVVLDGFRSFEMVLDRF